MATEATGRRGGQTGARRDGIHARDGGGVCLMLDRSPSRRAAYQRAYRQRVRRGSVVGEIPASLIELLIRGEWLRPAEAADRHAITLAMDAMARSVKIKR